MRRLLHLSDIHFGPPHHEPAAVGVEALVRERRPDLVVVSGDLTQRAKPRQFRQARRFLEGLERPYLAVPGNHDVPMYRFWERFLDRYGAYSRHFDADLEPAVADEEMEVVGFNTACNLTIADGRFTDRQVAGIRGRFGSRGSAAVQHAPGMLGNDLQPGRVGKVGAVPAPPVRIAVAHHPLAALPELMGWQTARRSAEALAAFAAAGVDLVLSGHVHVAAVGRAPDCPRPMWLVHSGTSTSRRGRGAEKRRNSCNWITLEAGPEGRTARVEQLFWSERRRRFEVEATHDCELA